MLNYDLIQEEIENELRDGASIETIAEKFSQCLSAAEQKHSKAADAQQIANLYNKYIKKYCDGDEASFISGEGLMEYLDNLHALSSRLTSSDSIQEFIDSFK